MQGKIGFHKEKMLLQEKSILDHSRKQWRSQGGLRGL
jgi:hypothetical protein